MQDTKHLLFSSGTEYLTEIFFFSAEELVNCLLGTSDRFARYLHPSNNLFIIDKNVYELYEDYFAVLLQQSPLFLYKPTEENKDHNNLLKIIDFLINNRVTRNMNIIAVGGGITLDITAFAASIYKRGCSLTLVPTTFLAMSDASVGGKTGINYHDFKNILGSFYPASHVLIAPFFLTTLSEKERLNGWAECIKVSLLESDTLYELIVESQGNISHELIRQAICRKIDYCRSDLTDKGKRLKLNLGHTIAHLIESVSEYQISHGVAVALGLRTISRFCLHKRYIDEDTYSRINHPLNSLGFPRQLEKRYHDRIRKEGTNILEMDKKKSSSPRLVIFQGFRETGLLADFDYEELLNALLTL